MLPLLLLIATATPQSVAVNELSRVNVQKELATFSAEHVGQVLSTRGLKVITQSDIVAALGLERQKQLLGCADDGSSCTAELAQAMGVDFLLTGTIARLGDLLQVNLKLVDARTGAARATWSGSTRNDGDLPESLTHAAHELADGLGLSKQAPVAPAPLPAAAFWVPLSAGIALIAAGGVSFGVKEADHGALVGPVTLGPLSGEQALTARERGKALQIAAPILAGVGAAALLTAVIVKVAGKPTPVTASITPTGAAVVFAGEF